MTITPRMVPMAHTSPWASIDPICSSTLMFVISPPSSDQTRTQPSVPPVRMHGVGDLGIPRKVIAETIAGKLGVEAKSITKEEAPHYLGFLASFVGLDNPTSNDKTRRVLGWEPAHTGWVQDVQTGHYIT